MRLTVVGCSGGYPSPTAACSAYLVEHDGFRLLLDLGNGALGPLQRHTDPRRLDAVVLTHLHGDHCLDLCVYRVARRHHPDGVLPPLPVWAPTGAAERLAAAYGAQQPEPVTDTFDLRLLDAGELTAGPLRLRTVRMRHQVPTFGVRVEADGASLTYSADTGPGPELAELAAGTDVLLCEAGYGDVDEAPGADHLTARQAGAAAAEAGARRLVLTHLPPWADAASCVAQAAAAYEGPVTAATPDLVVAPG